MLFPKKYKELDPKNAKIKPKPSLLLYLFPTLLNPNIPGTPKIIPPHNELSETSFLLDLKKI